MDFGLRLKEGADLEGMTNETIQPKDTKTLVDISSEAITYLRRIPRDIAIRAYRTYESLPCARLKEEDPDAALVVQAQAELGFRSERDTFEEKLLRWEADIREMREDFTKEKYLVAYTLLTDPASRTTGIRKVAQLAYALLNR